MIRFSSATLGSRDNSRRWRTIAEAEMARGAASSLLCYNIY